MCFVANRSDFSSCSIPATVGKTTEKNSTESRLFVVVDHTWILGVALASFLLTVASNVSMFFCTCSSSFAAKSDKWAHCCSRLRHIQSAHKKNKTYRKHLHSDKAHSENVTHSNEERNTTRGSVAPSSKTQHTTFTMSSRVINPNKQTVHDAVKCGSPDGADCSNLRWWSARKRDRPASDATLSLKIGQPCASQWLKQTGARGTKSTTRFIYMAVYCGHVHFQVSQCRTMTRPN